MTRRSFAFATAALAALALSAPPALAQSVTAPKTTVLGTQIHKPAAGPVSRPTRRPGVNAGQASHPGSSNLTAQECRNLGGKTTVDDSGSCKLHMRCTIIHGNGDVYSSCIDEAG
jgi:hypothetical protein